MPRPKPEEELIPFTMRLTRKQIRKLQEIGAPTLRKLIGEYRPPEDAAHRARLKEQRNRRICLDPRPSQELVNEFKLSRQQLNAIGRTYRA